MTIPIVDLFAGPGGLGEGFSSVIDKNKNRVFQIKLSIEKDYAAYQTLKLRSFYRKFKEGAAPEEYYQFLEGAGLTLEELYGRFPKESQLAEQEAWCATLGKPDKGDSNGVANIEVDRRIRIALNDEPNWVLIGGPPCQAYSLVGRARRQEVILDEERDNRVGLYKEYLRIIAMHNPAVFVMENVKGLLSARTRENNVFSKILRDLENPLNAFENEEEFVDVNFEHKRYRIYSLVTPPRGEDEFGNPIFFPSDFVIKAEEFGVPQRRHRVILLGLREDIHHTGEILKKEPALSLSAVIGGLPAVRSGITREFTHSETIITDKGKVKKKRCYIRVNDSSEEWRRRFIEFNEILDDLFNGPFEGYDEKLLPSTLGKEFWSKNDYDLDWNNKLKSWYHDNNLKGVLHHNSRKHLTQDIKRYLFAARYTQKFKNFPRLQHYRNAGNDLLPDHKNVNSGKFTDRFRVQLPNIPATTITSHISKDGHYFIHYDPKQARSLTVREAARIQTFPDNYYFYGGRTQKYHQVGNAVPPYLAFQIGEIVKRILLQ